jgi:hypothetical protein
VIAALFGAIGCEKATSPNIFGPLPVGALDGSLSGTVVAFGSGEPVPRATLIMSGSAAVADAEGRFTFPRTPSSGAAGLTTDVNGFLIRGIALQLAPARSGVVVDLIRNAAPFPLTFYRQFARNGFASPVLTETRPWTVDPSFYVRVVTVDTSERVPDDVIESIRVMFERSVPELSGGRRRMAAFETGDLERPAAEGWVTVVFYQVPPGGVFGQSTVGGNSAAITLRYPIASTPTTNPFGCSSATLGVADHEITHTMGFWHTENLLVDTFSGPGCPGAPRTELARYHAELMYSRPRGNRDPDVDPVDVIQATAGGTTGPGPVVFCFRPR